jgi:hypothetical protein
MGFARGKLRGTKSSSVSPFRSAFGEHLGRDRWATKRELQSRKSTFAEFRQLKLSLGG